MDKETEIKHLQALSNGDTYFSQFFKKSDVDQMVQNIKNDFPIELGCTFIAKADALSKTLKETREKAEQDKFGIAVAILSAYCDGEMPDALYAVVQAICGSPLRLIEAKTAANVPPTREEVEYLIKLAKNK